jgi:hypothetical protein
MTTNQHEQNNENGYRKQPVIRLRIQDIFLMGACLVGGSGGAVGYFGHSDARVDIVKLQDRLTVLEERMNTQAQGLISGMEMIHKGQLSTKESSIQIENLTRIISELNQKLDHHMDRTETPDKRWPPKQ